jgi:mannitol/fructose-specific phosphotransferase system IIA component (Ntr-type)
MKISDFVVRDAILPDLQGTERDQVIRELIAALVAAGVCPEDLQEPLTDQIIEREVKGSTGFGKGVAIPHVKHERITTMAAAVGISQSGIDFNALDRLPVYSVILLLSPMDHPEEHLQAMEKIFTILQKDQFRRFLRQASSVEDVMDLIQEADAQQLSS